MGNFPTSYSPTPKPTVIGNIFEIRADRSIRATGGRYASNLDTNFVVLPPAVFDRDGSRRAELKAGCIRQQR